MQGLKAYKRAIILKYSAAPTKLPILLRFDARVSATSDLLKVSRWLHKLSCVGVNNDAIQPDDNTEWQFSRWHPLLSMEKNWQTWQW